MITSASKGNWGNRRVKVPKQIKEIKKYSQTHEMFRFKMRKSIQNSGWHPSFLSSYYKSLSAGTLGMLSDGTNKDDRMHFQHH